jgi:transposase InsO family protein
VSCRALGVSPGWFYKWRHGDGSLRRKRRAALAALIRYLFDKHHGSYGSPRITADLRDLGWRISKNTVAALMREQQLVARPKRRRRSLTKADKSARTAPDALGRDFRAPPAPNLRWCGDLTEIPTDGGRFYLLLTWNQMAGEIVTDCHRHHGVRGAVARESGGEVARPGPARASRRVARHLDQPGSCAAHH